LKLVEEKLEGGNISSVAKIGKTVRRNQNKYSNSIHELLKYLEKSNYHFSPRYLGTDEKNREILTYIEGEVGNDPVKNYIRSTDMITMIAKEMRQFHDQTKEFYKSTNLTWQINYPNTNENEVICHNDFAPYNTVFRNEEPVGLIDFDMCGPGPINWDIAYSLFTYIPLSSYWEDENGKTIRYNRNEHMKDRKEKIQVFFESYGIEMTKKIMDMVIFRIEYLKDFIIQKVQINDPSFIKMKNEGHIDHYSKEIEFIRNEGQYWI
jgi:thiamine kinase-like enzyme